MIPFLATGRELTPLIVVHRGDHAVGVGDLLQIPVLRRRVGVRRIGQKILQSRSGRPAALSVGRFDDAGKERRVPGDVVMIRRG